MKQASLFSSSVHGGGKRRAVTAKSTSSPHCGQFLVRKNIVHVINRNHHSHSDWHSYIFAALHAQHFSGRGIPCALPNTNEKNMPHRNCIAHLMGWNIRIVFNQFRSDMMMADANKYWSAA